jgi:hypothetical protein
LLWNISACGFCPKKRPAAHNKKGAVALNPSFSGKFAYFRPRIEDETDIFFDFGGLNQKPILNLSP